MQIWAQMMRATCYYERSLKRKKKKKEDISERPALSRPIKKFNSSNLYVLVLA